MARTRFIIEGVWSGYTGSLGHVVHRTVHPASCKSLRAWAEEVQAIHYTDGTALFLSVRDCKPYERVEQIHGYDSLIRDCHFYNVTGVEALGRVKRKEVA